MKMNKIDFLNRTGKFGFILLNVSASFIHVRRDLSSTNADTNIETNRQTRGGNLTSFYAIGIIVGMYSVIPAIPASPESL